MIKSGFRMLTCVILVGQMNTWEATKLALCSLQVVKQKPREEGVILIGSS